MSAHTSRPFNPKTYRDDPEYHKFMESTKERLDEHKNLLRDLPYTVLSEQKRKLRSNKNIEYIKMYIECHKCIINDDIINAVKELALEWGYDKVCIGYNDDIPTRPLEYKIEMVSS